MSKIIAVVLFVLAAMIPTIVLAQEDLEPPTLLNVSFEPEVIDTSKGPVTVTVTVHVADDLSGAHTILLHFYKPDTTQSAMVVFEPGRPEWLASLGTIESGDLNDGHYATTLTLPQYSAFGIWEMNQVYLEDKVGNSISHRKPEGNNLRGGDEWPSIWNGFIFAVGAKDTPEQPAGFSLFLPALAT